MELALKLRHAATWKWAISEKCCRMTDGSASVIANVNKHQMAWEYLCACPIQSILLLYICWSTTIVSDKFLFKTDDSSTITKISEVVLQKGWFNTCLKPCPSTNSPSCQRQLPIEFGLPWCCDKGLLPRSMAFDLGHSYPLRLQSSRK